MTGLVFDEFTMRMCHLEGAPMEGDDTVTLASCIGREGGRVAFPSVAMWTTSGGGGCEDKARASAERERIRESPPPEWTRATLGYAFEFPRILGGGLREKIPVQRGRVSFELQTLPPPPQCLLVSNLDLRPRWH